MPNSFSSRGIILHLIPYGESDLIGALLCEGYGKIKIIAKGARRSKRRFMGGLDIFDCGLFEISDSSPDRALHLLLGVSQRRTWSGLRTDLSTLAISSLLLETTDRLLMEGDTTHSELFPALLSALELVNDKCEREQAIRCAARYLVSLLSHCGYDPSHDEAAFTPSVRQGFLEIARYTESSPPLPRLLLELIGYIEKIGGKKLKTRDLLLPVLNRQLSALPQRP